MQYKIYYFFDSNTKNKYQLLKMKNGIYFNKIDKKKEDPKQSPASTNDNKEKNTPIMDDKSKSPITEKKNEDKSKSPIAEKKDDDKSKSPISEKKQDPNNKVQIEEMKKDEKIEKNEKKEEIIKDNKKKEENLKDHNKTEEKDHIKNEIIKDHSKNDKENSNIKIEHNQNQKPEIKEKENAVDVNKKNDKKEKKLYDRDKAIGKEDNRDHNFIAYRPVIENKVLPVLMQGLSQLANLRPTNQLEFLGKYLLNHSKNN